MLAKRVMTSAVLIALLIFVLTSEHRAVWPAFLAIAGSFAAEEWASFKWGSSRIGFFYALATGLIAIGLLQPAVFSTVLIPFCVCSILFWILICPIWLRQAWPLPNTVIHAFVGWVLIFPTLLALNAIRMQGMAVLFGLLGIVWVSDISAYFVGRAFGRRRLAPSISPGKTWEGVFGALFGVLVLGLLGLFLSPNWSALHDIIQGLGFSLFPALLGVAILGIEGDLFESWVKRSAGVKDSGWILPGHGGVLDRIDALTAALPMVVVYLKLFPGMPLTWSGM